MSGTVRTVRGNVVDPESRTIRPAEVEVRDQHICAIRETQRPCSSFLLPGFIDAHIHIESSMLAPSEFARAAVTHGTVATVSDPHEIANVLGIAGIQFMLDDAARVPLKVCIGVPSCVPATLFETAGAALDADDVASLLENPRLGYLSEMMNYPGVLHQDQQVMAKLAAAQRIGKPIDGHAPGLRGDEAAAYFAAGITTDHECTTKDEALDKLAAGAKILIRDGSAARNFDALYSLIDEFPERVMFCSDDKHPDQLQENHINRLVRLAVSRGQDMMNVLRCACVNPIDHYGLDVGRLRVGDKADFIEVSDLSTFDIQRTFIDGAIVAEQGAATFSVKASPLKNHFHCQPIEVSDIQLPAKAKNIRVMEAVEGELITTSSIHPAKIENGYVVPDVQRDLLKIAVVNRYQTAPPAVAFVKNFGLQRGAIASSVSHDCHNIVVVGASDSAMCQAVNAIVQHQGGLAAVDDDQTLVLPLPIAGLMSNQSFEHVGNQYRQLNELAKRLKSPMKAPFMTLSFMTLLVIPALKLSDQGLFDAEKFEFVSVFAP